MVFVGATYFYRSNVFPLRVNELNQVSALIIPSNALKQSISKIIKMVRIQLREQESHLKCYAGIQDKHIVILSSASDILYNIEQSLYDMKVLKNDKYIFTFSEVPHDKKLIAYKALSKSLELYVLNTLYQSGWQLSTRNRAYDPSDNTSHVDLRPPLSDFVDIYYGVQIKGITAFTYDFLGKRYYEVGICIDPILIIELKKNLKELKEEGIIYKEDKVLTKEERVNEIYGFRLLAYNVWNIKDMKDEKALIYRLRRKGKSWIPEQSLMDLSDLFPLRRPEVLDYLIKTRYPHAESLVIKIKQLAFHITSERRRDPYASYKRYQLMMLFSHRVREILSRYKFLDTFHVNLSEDPLFISTSW